MASRTTVMALVAVAATTATAWVHPSRPALPARPTRRVVVRAVDEEEAAIMREAEQIAKKKRSNLYNEKGVPYAPWMVRQVDEEATNIARELRKYRKRKEKLAEFEADGTVNILDAATSELSGMGLKAKSLSDTEVELVWGTEDEERNRGFFVEKKPVGPGQWEEVANYKTWSPLKSKGTLGGAYSYVDTDADQGEYLYRVVAEQLDGSRSITCQVAVTVESQGQQLQTKIIVGATVLIFVGFLIAGLSLDPIAG